MRDPIFKFYDEDRCMTYNSMFYWWPRIKKLDIPMPRTEMIWLGKDKSYDLFSALDGNAEKSVPIQNEIYEKIIEKFPPGPMFIRGDHTSDKHSWERTCFIKDNRDRVDTITHLIQLIESHDLHVFIGPPMLGYALRELIPTDPIFYTFHGNMPITREYRFFYSEGEVACFHPYWCCSEDTEILTENGFKKFDNLSEEKVFSLNPETHEIELVTPSKYISYFYTGDMIHIKNHNFDMLVTPEHRLFIHDGRGLFKFIEAKNMRYNYRIPRTGKWIGNGKNTVEIGGVIYPARYFFELMGYYLSEGNYDDKSKTRCSGFSISQNRSTIDPMLKCLEKLEISFGVSERQDGRCRIGVARKEYETLAEYLNLGKSFEKYIPTDLKKYPIEYLRVLLDSFLYGDGNVSSKDIGGFESIRRTYYTSSERLANDICELILKVGKRPSIYRYHKKSDFTIRGKTYRTKHPVFTINECGSKMFRATHPNAHKNRNIRFERVEYSGMVHCVSLPKNHIIYIKRNGKCSWTGNCHESIEREKKYSWGKDLPADWREKLDSISHIEEPNILELLTNRAIAIGKAIECDDVPSWSIDFLQGSDGIFYFIDCADALASEHWNDCPVGQEKFGWIPRVHKKESDFSDFLAEMGMNDDGGK